MQMVPMVPSTREIPSDRSFRGSLELTMEEANTGCRLSQFGHANHSGGRCFKEITGEMMSKV